MPREPKVSHSVNEADELAFAAARAICRRHARSFYFSSAFLPKLKRDAAYAVYAFCRMIDDAIDQPAHSSVPLAARLEMLGDRLNDVYAHRLELPAVESRDEAQHALRALEMTVQRY